MKLGENVCMRALSSFELNLIIMIKDCRKNTSLCFVILKNSLIFSESPLSKLSLIHLGIQHDTVLQKNGLMD